MGNLFKPSVPDPEPPAPMPDERDPKVMRAKRAATGSSTGRASTRLAQQPGTIGQEYSRGTLG